MFPLFPEPQGDEASVRKKAKTFVDTFVRPSAIEDDKNARFRRELFGEFIKAGLASLLAPKAYGGEELPFSCFTGIIEELARGTLSIAITAGVNNLPQGAILQFGSEEQKKEYLPRFASGELLGAFSLSEPGSGSDAASLQCKATPVDGGYRITGTKLWCSTVGSADLYLLMARTGPDKTKGITAFLLPKDAKGFRPGKLETKMGIRSSPLGELIFEDCFLPESLRLGKEGEGLSVALSQLDGGRIVIAAAAVGLSIEALDRICRYRAEKGITQDGFEGILATHYADLQAAKTLLAEASRQKELGGKITGIASQVKLFATELAVRLCTDAVSCLGEAGAAEENEVERLFRDSKCLPIVEGTNQIQQLVLARHLQKSYE